MVEQDHNHEHAEGFSVDWLDLREPADHQARSLKLTNKLAQWRENFDGFNVVDLGSGTASNLRYLCPRLGKNQSWTLLDNDDALLSSIAERLKRWALESNVEFHQVSATEVRLSHNKFSAQVNWQRCDLALELSENNFEKTQLITGSALLDLTSAKWIDTLADTISSQNCASLFVLNYNGQIQWTPGDGYDDVLASLLNAHQLNDKGFGNALGPEAHNYFHNRLHHCSINIARTDWILNEEIVQMQEVLIKDWTTAAKAQDVDDTSNIEKWSRMRSEYLKSGNSILRVGHTDILSLPIE